MFSSLCFSRSIDDSSPLPPLVAVARRLSPTRTSRRLQPLDLLHSISPMLLTPISITRLRDCTPGLGFVLKHEVIIEELLEENEKLRRILIEDLKISPHKFHSKHSTNSTSSCHECSDYQNEKRRR